MKLSIFSLVFCLFLQNPIELAYFYFGHTNIIGVGNLVEGKKSGEWKVYSKITPEVTPNSSLLQTKPEIFKRYFNQDFPIYVINFSEDNPEGIFQGNFSSGAIKTLAFFEKGELTNEFKEFYENGEIKYSGKFEKGKKIGDWTEYFESGGVKSFMPYVNGLIEGDGFYYYPEGGVQIQLSYLQGKLNGIYQNFLPDGKIKEKGNFLNGSPHGDWSLFGAEGELLSQGSFTNGIPTGEWIEQEDILPDYYRKGNYKNGLKEGEWHLTDRAGKLYQTENYQEGKLMTVGGFLLSDQFLENKSVKNGNGKRSYFDEEGDLIARGKIAKGKRNGNWYFYYPKTNRVSAVGRLVGSERLGTWYFYSFHGEVIDQKSYPNRLSETQGNNVNLDPQGWSGAQQNLVSSGNSTFSMAHLHEFTQMNLSNYSFLK